MDIGFRTIPASVLTPGFFAEFDGSRAIKGLASLPNEAVILAQKLTAGTATVEVPVLVASPDEAAVLFGVESQAHEMVRAYKQIDALSPCWVVPYADGGSAVSASGSITWTGPATASGVLVLYIGGRRIEVGVASGDTAATVETSALAAIALVANSLPVTVAGDAATGVDLTARHGGTIGNQILLGVCLQPGEKVPAGLTVTVTAMASGATDTSYANAIAALGEDLYPTVVAGNNAATPLGLLVTEFESRWEAMRAVEGSIFACKQDTHANLITYAASFNSGMLVAVGCEKTAMEPLPWEISAQTAALSNLKNQINPAQGCQGQSYAGQNAAPRGSRFTRAQRNALLKQGIATVKAGSDGRLLVERLVTTFKTNALSLPDTSLQDHSTVRNLAAQRYTWRARFSSKFGGWLLADDGNEVSGQQIATPATIKGESIAWYGDLCDAGWCQNPKQFAKEVLVQRHGSDVNRVDMILPTNLVRNLLVGAAQIAYA